MFSQNACFLKMHFISVLKVEKCRDCANLSFKLLLPSVHVQGLSTCTLEKKYECILPSFFYNYKKEKYHISRFIS